MFVQLKYCTYICTRKTKKMKNYTIKITVTDDEEQISKELRTDLENLNKVQNIGVSVLDMGIYECIRQIEKEKVPTKLPEINISDLVDLCELCIDNSKSPFPNVEKYKNLIFVEAIKTFYGEKALEWLFEQNNKQNN